MIIHVHHDGSEGFEYEIGDEVQINKEIGGFKIGVGKTGKITKISHFKIVSWRTADIYVRHSDDWGPSFCYPWMLEPTEATRAKASYINVGDEGERP